MGRRRSVRGQTDAPRPPTHTSWAETLYVKLGTKTLGRGQVGDKKRQRGKRHWERETRGSKGMSGGKGHRTGACSGVSVLGERRLGSSRDLPCGFWVSLARGKARLPLYKIRGGKSRARCAVFTDLYKAERLWEERVCSEGRPGTSTATSSSRRTISWG